MAYPTPSPDLIQGSGIHSGHEQWGVIFLSLCLCSLPPKYRVIAAHSILVSCHVPSSGPLASFPSLLNIFLPRASEFPVSLLHSSPSHLYGLLHWLLGLCSIVCLSVRRPLLLSQVTLTHTHHFPTLLCILISPSDKFHFPWEVKCLCSLPKTPPVFMRQGGRLSACLWVWEEEEEKPERSLLLWISVLLDFLQPAFTIWSCCLEAESESSLDTGLICLFFTKSAWMWQVLCLECRGSCFIILSFRASAQVQRWKVKLHSMCY